jgi:hypothetical protein
MTWSNKASDIQEKHMFIASWPGEDYAPELWTFQDVDADFGDDEDLEFISLIITMKVGETLHEEESNLLLERVHASHSLGKKIPHEEEESFEEV